MSFWKSVVGLAVALPMAAYVAGSLLGAQAGDPSPRETIVIQEAPASTSPRPDVRTPKSPGADADKINREDDVDDNGVQVVTPQPARIDDDGEEADDQRDDGDDDRVNTLDRNDRNDRDDAGEDDDGGDDGGDD